MSRAVIALAVTLSLIGACRTQQGSGAQAGRLEARWVGADTGKLSAAATAEWCAETRILEIRAVERDTGLALALFPDVVIVEDTYPVVSPSRADSSVPSARVALRWFGPTAISGFQGDSGAVVLETMERGQLSGSMKARASSVINSDRITIIGTFEHLAVMDQSRGCIPEPPLEDGQAAETDEVD